jgi:hypothetical protein
MVMLRTETENVVGGGGGHWILDFGAISAKIFFATSRQSPMAFFPPFSQQCSLPTSLSPK